jgi:hypothetical protein
MARRKAQNLWFPLPCGLAAGASRRASRGDLTAPGRAFRFSGGCSNAPPSSASSWQDLLVDPGGAPAPPGSRFCDIDPQAPHPIPLSQRLAMAPLNGRGGTSLGWFENAGINLINTICSERLGDVQMAGLMLITVVSCTCFGCSGAKAASKRSEPPLVCTSLAV